MARKLRSVASRGSVNNIILESLMTGQKYGYEIIKEVEEKTNGKIKLKQPSLYSSLKRFESKNIITSYWGDSDIGGRRHYYKLTDAGRKYCEKLLNKEFDGFDDNEFDDTDKEIDSQEDNITSIEGQEDDSQIHDEAGYEIDTDTDDEVELNKKYAQFSVEEKMKELLDDKPTEFENVDSSPNTQSINDTLVIDQTTNEIETQDYQLEPDDEKEELLNQFYDEIENDSLQNPTEEFVEQNIEEIIPDHNFYKPIPLNDYKNEKYEESYNILFSNQPTVDHKLKEEKTEEQNQQEVMATRKKKIITDEYGITKLVYEDEENWNNRPSASAIMTNVNNINIDLVKLAEKPKKNKNILDELSDEEREERNMRFVQKFDSISNNRKSSSPAPINTIAQQQEEIEYKDKLNNLFVESPQEEIEDIPYLEKERNVVESQNLSQKLTDTIDDQSINVKVYSKSKQTKSDSKYLQINKVKFTFGVVMLILMLLELTVAMIIMKDKGILYKDKMWAFQVSYVIVGVICLLYCVPVFISPNKQTPNLFKLSYSFVFGLLAFFVSLILIYTLNTFMGLSFDNIKYFAPTIVAPVILASNFIVGPLLFKVLTLNKNFYQ